MLVAEMPASGSTHIPERMEPLTRSPIIITPEGEPAQTSHENVTAYSPLSWIAIVAPKCTVPLAAETVGKL